jgi:PAS domain S-box-containing protein
MASRGTGRAGYRDWESRQEIGDVGMAVKTLGAWNSDEYGVKPALMDLFEHLPDVFFFAKDLEGRFTMANHIFIEKCGMKKPEDLFGLTDFDVFPRHLAEKYVRDDKQVTRSGEALVNVIELVIHIGKSTDWYSTTKLPVRNEAGKIIGLAGFTRDIKKMESGSRHFSEMGEVFDYVMEHYPESIDMSKLASIVCLSISQFERRFKTLFKISPLKYITMVRIHAACQALAEGSERISDIALNNGFYDLSHFNRQFKGQMSMSPSAYRKKYAGVKGPPLPWLSSPGERAAVKATAS